VQAQLTQAVPSIATVTPSPIPVLPTAVPPTLAPPPTVIVIPTATTICDIAQFITDVTIQDDTILTPGETFTKTWRFKNVGVCSWTPSYAIVFASGNSMNGPATQALAGNVNTRADGGYFRQPDRPHHARRLQGQLESSQCGWLALQDFLGQYKGTGCYASICDAHQHPAPCHCVRGHRCHL